MLLTTGIIALSRKIGDEKAKRREAKQGLMKVGDSNTARQAFESQTKLIDQDRGPLRRPVTEILYEKPGDVRSPDTPSSTYSYDHTREFPTDSSSRQHNVESDEDTRLKSPVETSSKLQHEGVTSPASTRTFSSPSDTNPPPPYSPASSSQPVPSPSIYSQDSDTLSRLGTDPRSSTSGSATVLNGPDGIHAIRVRTKGSDLKSGFAYHPELFDLRVRPEQWDRFQSQVIECTKFSFGDNAKIAAAATATALTGAFVTSVLVGRSVNQSIQEKKVRIGLNDMSDGGLGDVLQRWNETEFHDLKLFVHLELSESAMKHPERKGFSVRKPASLYSKREERERKTEARKFVLVVSRLDEEGVPNEAIQELAGNEEEIVEAPNPEKAMYDVPELPGDEGRLAVELPADVPGEKEEPEEYAELESETLLEKLVLERKINELPAESVEDLRPPPLLVTAETHAALNKEIE